MLAACLLAASTGCHAIDYYTPSLQSPVPPELEPPRELSKMSLPTYRIEPPDIIRIEVLKLVPRPPYRIEAYDVLQIDVHGAMLDQPINGYYLVEGDGIVTLGPAYGTVYIQGMTIKEATAEITRSLQLTLQNPHVSLQLARPAAIQAIPGAYMIQPDGTVNLFRYGVVELVGKNVTEAREALEKHLARYFDSPQVTVEVLAYNSDTYYVLSPGVYGDDDIYRLPITGNETVLDAISKVGGLSRLSSKTIWVARPAPSAFGQEQILPVDWDAIARGGATGTNYQVLPGDRVYIVEDKLIAANSTIGKFTYPFERLLGITSLGSSMTRSLQLMGRNYNRTRRN